MKIPKSFIQECLTYDPVSGNLFWKERPRSHYSSDVSWKRSNTNYAGKIAGSNHFCRGLKHAVKITVLFQGKYHEIHAHNLAFCLMGIEIPEGMVVDHKDNDQFNNSWSNLRLATISQNAQNKRSNREKKHALPKGVYKAHSGKYRSSIFVNGYSNNLGLFSDPESAHKAYCEAAKIHFGEFARTN